MSSPITEKSGMILGANRGKIVLIIGTVFAAAIVVYLLVSHPEPEYQGKTVTASINGWAARKQFDPQTGEALKHFGTKALPYLIANPALNHSIWHTNYSNLHPKM